MGIASDSTDNGNIRLLTKFSVQKMFTKNVFVEVFQLVLVLILGVQLRSVFNKPQGTYKTFKPNICSSSYH